jgi:hypothetical protein
VSGSYGNWVTYKDERVMTIPSVEGQPIETAYPGAQIQVLMTIAVLGGADDWAAYRAPIMNDRVIYQFGVPTEEEPLATAAEMIDQVMRRGDKLSEEEARRLYPTLKDLEYRL